MKKALLMDTECTDTGHSFMCSCFNDDDGSNFDMGLTLPSNGNKSPLQGNRESEDFEFSVSVSATNKPNIKECVDNVSPADDLFYRGQLLPLNLPPRLEMVRYLSAPKEFQSDTDGFNRYSEDFKEFQSDTDGFNRYSEDFRDSNQRPGCWKEFRCRSAETEEKTPLQPIVKSATKLKVKTPIFGFSKFSEEGMDDLNCSSHIPPPLEKLLRFTVKLKSVKATSVRCYNRDCSTKQNPYSPENGNRTRTSNSVKHVVQKYAKLVKHRISSERNNDAHTGDQQLKRDKGRVCPCVPEESGRQNDVGVKRFGSKSCLPSVNSPLNLSSDDLQSAIAYCKQSNGGIDKKKH